MPLFFFMNLWAFCITVKFLSPKKSIFKSPSSSKVVIIYCVVIEPSAALDNGTYSSTGFPQITTPAACIDACRGSPSSLLDISIRYFTSGSESYNVFNSIFCFKAPSRVMLSSCGIIFAILST